MEYSAIHTRYMKHIESYLIKLELDWLVEVFAFNCIPAN
jgi:hypothetical protein